MKQVSLFREFSYDVTVVIASYHTGPALWRSVESVLQQEGLNELVLVDNGNSEETRRRLVKKSLKNPRLKVVSGGGNLGLYAAYNLGAERAKGRYLLFLSPEAVLPHDFLIRMVDEHRQSTDSWASSCRILDINGKERRESRRSLLSLKPLLCEKLGLSKLFRKKCQPWHLTATAMPTQNTKGLGLSASCMFTETERFKQLQGFSEGYFYQYGDMDMALKIHDMGGETLFIPKLSIIDFRTTSASKHILAYWHAMRDFVHYFRINFSKAYLPGVIPLLAAFSYAKLLFKAIGYFPFLFLKRTPKAQKESNYAAKFLSTYASYEHAEDEKNSMKGTVYDFSQRSPILLAGAHTETGLCLLRRLLAADVEVIALYHDHVIDFDHPKLTWFHADLLADDVSLYGQHPKTLIFADELHLLPNHLQTFAEIGINRMVCIASAYIFRLLESKSKEQQALAKAYFSAEKEIVRTAPILNIDYTILRAGMVYGMGLDNSIARIAKFIKRFGFFPVYPPADGKRQPIHCDDLAISAISSLNRLETFGKSYNICGPDTLSYYEMIRKLFEATGKKPRIIKMKSIGYLIDVYRFFFAKSSGFLDSSTLKRANKDILFEQELPLPESAFHFRHFIQNGMKDILPEV